MKFLIQKYFLIISLALLAAFMVSLIFYPAISSWPGISLLVIGLSMALFFIIQKHLHPYKQGHLTRLKFTRNVLLDLLGLLLTIAAASYLGGMAGMRLGASFGLWAGLVAGMASAFIAAWFVRKLWNKASAVLMG